MKVWDTECVGSRTQATSLGWQVFIQRMVSESWSLAILKKGTNTHTHKKKRRHMASKAHTNRASLGDMDIAVNIKNNLCDFGRIINQQWPKLMPKAKLCSVVLWRWVLPLMLFWHTVSSCVGNELLHSQRMIHNLLRKIFGFAEHPPASHQIISWGGFMGQGSVLKDS